MFRFLGLFCLVLVGCRPSESGSVFSLPLSQKFGKLLAADQRVRNIADSVRQLHGLNSPAYQAALRNMLKQDSININAVSRVLDSCGWLGTEVIGNDGNIDLFIAIQHADTATMVKYLPMLKAAVKANKAMPADAAMMEDRILVARKKPQIYGSQIYFDEVSNAYQLFPLQDTAGVETLRASVGLGPLHEYVSKWQIQWLGVNKKQ